MKLPGLRWLFLQAVTNVVLTGVPDEILRDEKNRTTILDYKTAVFSARQDSLAPLREVQLNCYAMIATKIGNSIEDVKPT